MHRTIVALGRGPVLALLTTALVAGCGGNRELGQPAPPPTTPPELTHALQASDELATPEPAPVGEATDATPPSPAAAEEPAPPPAAPTAAEGTDSPSEPLPTADPATGAPPAPTTP